MDDYRVIQNLIVVPYDIWSDHDNNDSHFSGYVSKYIKLKDSIRAP